MRAEHIVVGVDGSTASRRALAWAVDQAGRTGATVEAVHAWAPPDLGPDTVSRALVGTGDCEEAAGRELELVVGAADTSRLAAPVARTLVPGAAGPALVAAAEDADLLVVGGRGLDGPDGDGVGPVAEAVVRGVRCPVVVVPAG
ncbi:MAG TPA: universal stress protein [Acidimicrobiales bacterium]|nr:universal stress protein [Acidimicrobiales bacterium]